MPTKKGTKSSAALNHEARKRGGDPAQCLSIGETISFKVDPTFPESDDEDLDSCLSKRVKPLSGTSEHYLLLQSRETKFTSIIGKA
jgi:hypothetical protein